MYYLNTKQSLRIHMIFNKCIGIGISLVFISISCISQTLPHSLSIDDFQSEDIVIKGTYFEIISRYGYPINVFSFRYPDLQYPILIDEGTKGVDSLSFLMYDGYTFLRRGDSVQLAFIDFQKTSKEISLMGLKLSKYSRINQIEWQLRKQKIKNSGMNAGEKYGRIESHYLTYERVKVLYLEKGIEPIGQCLLCFRSAFPFYRLWYMELPIQLPMEQ